MIFMLPVCAPHHCGFEILPTSLFQHLSHKKMQYSIDIFIVSNSVKIFKMLATVKEMDLTCAQKTEDDL